MSDFISLENDFRNHFSDYEKKVISLSMDGLSHNQFISQADCFYNSYSIIINQMHEFGETLDLYKQYCDVKKIN